VSRRSITGFEDARGGWHELREPDARATGKQLLKLNAMGMLDIGQPFEFSPLTIGEAAAAIADTPDGVDAEWKTGVKGRRRRR
jgi:hypothetical protein